MEKMKTKKRGGPLRPGASIRAVQTATICMSASRDFVARVNDFCIGADISRSEFIVGVITEYLDAVEKAA